MLHLHEITNLTDGVNFLVPILISAHVPGSRNKTSSITLDVWNLLCNQVIINFYSMMNM